MELKSINNYFNININNNQIKKKKTLHKLLFMKNKNKNKGNTQYIKLYSHNTQPL